MVLEATFYQTLRRICIEHVQSDDSSYRTTFTCVSAERGLWRNDSMPNDEEGFNLLVVTLCHDERGDKEGCNLPH